MSNKQHRIAVVPSAFHPHIGGVEEMSKHLVAHLQRSGHEVVVCVNRHPQSLPETEVINGVSVRRFNFLYPSKGPQAIGWVVRAARTWDSYRRFLAGWSPDVVHLICAGPNSLYTALGADKYPLVATLHGERFMDAHGLYQKSAFARLSLQLLLDRVNCLTACSRYVLDDAGAHFRLGAYDKIVVPNGVDISEFDCQPGENPAVEPPYILAAGRLVHNKNFDVLLKAFSLIAAKHPDARLVIAGTGDEAPALSAMIDDLELAGRAILIDKPSRAQLIALYKNCLFYVLPSAAEPFGIVLLEAMACAKPVVAINHAGPPEFITDGQEGLLVPACEAEALAKAMQTLLGDRARLAEMGKRAYATSLKYDWSEITRQYLDIYEAVLPEASRKA